MTGPVSLRRGVAWLLKQQRDDGSWRSETYGSMKGGASITALALYALAHLPEAERQALKDQVERGFAFLQRGIKAKGFVACPDGTLDFPDYATAMTLVAARIWKHTFSKADLAPLRSFVLGEQRTEKQDFARDNPDYGGWDLSGGSGLRAQSTGTNISVTSFALESLEDLKSAEAEAARKLAIDWAKKVQNLPGDGGFFFHPERAADGNKALWTDDESREHPRSYGTATCDGLRCLAYAGVPADDPRTKAALAWLAKHPDVAAVPGFQDAPPELGWDEGLRYYYYLTLAKTARLYAAKMLPAMTAKIEPILLGDQGDDGAWQNASARMREDDPLIATSFSLIALGLIVRQK